MKLTELKSKGGIVDSGLVPKEVSWTHIDAESGEEVTDVFKIFVKRQAFGVMEQVFRSDAEGKSRSAFLISETIFLGEGGEEAMTYEDAFQLDTGLSQKFMEAFTEVNQPKKKSKN